MEIELLNHQYDFLETQEKYALLVGGIGSGKTFAGACFATAMSQQYPKAVGGIFANTHRQLNRATLKTFFSFLQASSIPFKYNRSSLTVTVNGSTEIYCGSLENYDALRGIEVGWIWGDEIAFADEAAINVIIGRLRDPNGPLLSRFTTTPKGKNWLYQMFEVEELGPLIRASSKKNKYLPQSYVDAIYNQYDDKIGQQELEGLFVNIHQGLIYYEFKDAIIKPTPRLPNHRIMIGMDFNVNPMTAVIAQVVNDQIRIIDEAFLMTSNTEEMSDYIITNYGKGHTVIPDSTGKAIKTSSAGYSDHKILREKGFIVPNVSNPFRRDRYNCVNNLLSKGRIVIDPKCKNLIKDLREVSYKEGKDIPDTSNSKLTHISDALGYLCWYTFPNIERKPITSYRYA